MISKIMIGSGTFLMVASLLGIIGGIFGSFQALKSNENAGIGSVGFGIEFALFSNIAFFVGLLVMILGLVMFFRDKSKNKT